MIEFTFSIVGGEREFQNELLLVFQDFPGFRCLSVSDDYEEALDNILREFPALVFIDVDKKGKLKNPFQFVNELYPYLHELPSFVAISSSKRSAYNVIKNNFLDYLLKPISKIELRKCLMKFQKQQNFSRSERLCLKSYSDYRFVDLDQILYLKADNNTTDFFLLEDRKISAYKTLKHFERLLPQSFLRVHNSYIINTRQITRINFGKSMIVLRGKSSDIPFSKSYRPQVDHLKERFFSSLSLVS